MDLDKNMIVLQKCSHNNVDFEVLAYDKLRGAQSVNMAQSMFFAEQTGLKVKQVRITLKTVLSRQKQEHYIIAREK